MASFFGDCSTFGLSVSIPIAGDNSSFMLNCRTTISDRRLVNLTIGATGYDLLSQFSLSGPFLAAYSSDLQYGIYITSDTIADIYSIDLATQSNRFKINTIPLSYGSILLTDSNKIYFVSDGKVYMGQAGASGQVLVADIPNTSGAIRKIHLNHNQTKLLIFNEDDSSQLKFFVVDLATHALTTIIPFDFVTGGNVDDRGYYLSNNSDLVLFRADPFLDDKFELFSFRF